ncbi:MAG: signal peptidase II [Actinobacteria bacterium]|nr:signal peptidase II [Actinomycetota bacterium]
MNPQSSVDEDGRAHESSGDGPGGRALLFGVALGCLVVVIDQLTKAWALRSFASEPRHVAWTLHLVVAYNTGTAFSLFSGRGVGPVIALVAVVVVVIVVWTLRFVRGWPAVVGSALIIGGALGNLADRLFRSHGAGMFQGAVVDWIDFGWWPVFNIADMAVTCGAILLAVAAFFAPGEAGDADDRGDADDAARSS